MMTKMQNLLLVAVLAVPLGASAGVTVDTQGWTRITPSADSRVVYVSSSQGNDANDGLTSNSPKATIAAANALMRDGYPDHLRLRRGDTFALPHSSGLQRWINGRSATEPAVVTSYGESGPRPVVEVTNHFVDHNGQARNYQAFVGLDFYKPISDPGNSNRFTNTSGSSALRLIGGGADILVEDCRFRFCSAVIQSNGQTNGQANLYSNPRFRRNIVLDVWTAQSYYQHGDGVGNIQGLYVSGVTGGYLIEENFFDHNGWSTVVPGAGANMFNHNVYVQYSNAAGGIMRGNIFARGAAHGLQARSGGVVERNLFVLNSVSFNMGGQAAPTVPEVLSFDNRAVQNVVLNGRLQDAHYDGVIRSGAVWGIAVAFIGQVDAIDNIVANRLESGSNAAFHVSNHQPPASFNLVNNIVYNWESGADMTNPSWPHPGDDLGDYYASIGGTNSTTAYLTWLRNRAPGTLPWEMTAYAPINYIRAGFNKAPVTGYFTYPQEPGPGPEPANVALGKPVTVSAFESGTTNNGSKLVDGTTDASTSRWSALGYPQWAEIDLGASYQLSQIRLHPYQNRAYRYTVEVGSTPSNYTTVVNRSSNTTGGAVLTDTVSVTGRYLRLTVTGASGYSGSWVSIGELEAIGTPAGGSQLGTITRDYWLNMPGLTLANLTNDPRFPASPTGTTPLTSLEAVSWVNPSIAENWADNYGQRIHGYLHPPTTGAYTFWIAGDDQCELQLSTDSNPANAQIIATVTGWTNRRQWNKYASQKSVPITLQAGQVYYLEVRHKEANSGDRVAVGWAKPGQSTSAPSEVIPGSVLSP